MIILRGYNVSYMAALGEQPVWNDCEYELAKHCLVTDVNNGKLILNNLTKSIVFLDKKDLDNLGDKDTYLFLYKTYFLVPKDFNSNHMIDKLRKSLVTPIDDFYLKNPTEFTILTTTKCNARCFYCYESKTKQKHHMSEDTALKVAKYIHKCVPNNEIASLDWFGGEPLFNQKAIDIITNYLSAKQVPFISSATSNGYLFDEKLVKKAVEHWKLQTIQITIDGTEEVYNKTKNYIYIKDSSPYKRVMNNIQLLLDAGIIVNIRINLDLYNSENVKSLISELFSRFGIRTNLNIYVWPIFDEGQRSKEDEDILYDQLEIIENLIVDYGYSYGLFPSEQIKDHHCMADVGNHVTISPYGELGTCEHFVDCDFFSSINNPDEKNYQILYEWKQYEKPLNICEDCPLYADCLRPVKCTEMHKCSDHIKKWKLRKATFELLNFYNLNRNNV